MTTSLPARRRSILHPDDQATQDKLNKQIIALRKNHFAQLPAGTYARRLGIAPSALWTLEHPDRVSQISRTAHGGTGRVSLTFGSIERRLAPMAHTLVAQLVGLPDVDDDPYVATLAARRSDDPLRRADITAALTVARLHAARIDLGVTGKVLAARVGVSHSAVAELNTIAGRGTRLATLQRIARALGGVLEPRLTPLAAVSR